MRNLKRFGCSLINLDDILNITYNSFILNDTLDKEIMMDMDIEMDLTDTGYETPGQVAKALHSMAYIHTVASDELANLQNTLDVIDVVIVRREHQLTPVGGWEGKNAEQRKIYRDIILWEDARYQRACNRRLKIVAESRLAEMNAKTTSRCISAYQSIASLVIAREQSKFFEGSTIVDDSGY